MASVRILLADDHALVRAGIRALLQTMPDVQVVAEADDGREAVSLAKKLYPDLVLMDIAMRGLNGLEATALLRKETPAARVVILSMHGNNEHVSQALHVGAAGYLLKDSAVPELELAVKSVMRGETYLSPAVATHVVSYVRRAEAGGVNGSSGRGQAGELLSSRQREVLQLIAEGRTTKEIASLLHLSVKTVETHRTQLMDRLDIHDIAGLVRYAIRTGLVTPEY